MELVGVPLMTLADVKVLLGLESDDDTYDTALTAALPTVTSWFERFCDRGLAQRTITDEESFKLDYSDRILTWAYPITTLTAVKIDDSDKTSEFLVSKTRGFIYPKMSSYVKFGSKIELTYTGGFPTNAVPQDLQRVYALCVGVQAAVPAATAASGGSGAIKAIGLGGGALNVQFDTTSSKGGFDGTYDITNVPPEVQAYAPVLNTYRRVVV